MPYLIALMLLMGGCSAPPAEEIQEVEAAQYTEDELAHATTEFADYMSSNFDQALWYNQLESFGIKEKNGKIVLGIITK